MELNANFKRCSSHLCILMICSMIFYCFPSSQVGACIVNQENKIVGIGYNGMPNGCDDDLLPWCRSAKDQLDTKYPYGENA